MNRQLLADIQELSQHVRIIGKEYHRETSLLPLLKVERSVWNPAHVFSLGKVSELHLSHLPCMEEGADDATGGKEMIDSITMRQGQGQRHNRLIFRPTQRLFLANFHILQSHLPFGV